MFIPLATWAQSCTRRKWWCPSCRLIIVILTWYSHAEKQTLVNFFVPWIMSSTLTMCVPLSGILEIQLRPILPLLSYVSLQILMLYCFLHQFFSLITVKRVAILILIGLGCCLFIRDSINPKSSICLLQLHFDCFILIHTFSAGWQLDGPFVYDPTCICGHAGFNHRGHGTTFTIGVKTNTPLPFTQTPDT